MNQQQLKTMLDMQLDFNKSLGDGWKSRNYLLAAAMETCEGIDHTEWCWWKKIEFNMAQLQMEMVDVWHFVMSFFLARHCEEVDVSVEILKNRLGFDRAKIEFDEKEFDCREMILIDKLSLFSAMAFVKKVNLKLFLSILKDCDMTTDDLYKMYIGKNVLNKFRQDHGYKDGHYKKDWDDTEDNVYLNSILKPMNHDCDIDLLRDQIYRSLETKYKKVLATVTPYSTGISNVK
jgi:dimeric dUTPase (all-alpha-NTP-PPase superfamily)